MHPFKGCYRTHEIFDQNKQRLCPNVKIDCIYTNLARFLHFRINSGFEAHRLPVFFISLFYFICLILFFGGSGDYFYQGDSVLRMLE